jgi:hypothetical protein
MVILLALVLLLGHQNWRIREQAMTELWHAGQLYPQVFLIAERSKDAEIQCRGRYLADKYICEHAEELLWLELPTNWDRVPWIDRLCCNTDPYYWVDQCNQKGRLQSDDDWEQWREATLLWLKDQVIARHPHIRRMIAEMCEAERGYYLNNPHLLKLYLPPPPAFKTGIRR